MNLLDKNLCLVLNAQWQAIGHVSVKRALISLCSEDNGQKAAMAMDMETITDENGDVKLIYSNPTSWEDWIKLPIRESDLYVNSAHQKIRVPTVIICGYTKIPIRRPRLGKSAIADRDKWICGYTGKKLTRSTFTVDHILPRSRGGKDSWENLTACDKAVNQLKGDKTPHEAGLRLLKQPKTPPSMPVIIRPEEAKDPSWLPFLVK